MKARLLSRVLVVATAVAWALSLSGASRETTASDWCSGGVCQEWVARWDHDNYDAVATAIAVDGSGNVYVTGSADSETYWASVYWTLKYNASGWKQWEVEIGDSLGGSADIPSDIAVDASGNVYVTGETCWLVDTVIPPVVGCAYTTVKYNTNGEPPWAGWAGRNYQGTGTYSRATALAVDGAGNVYVTGSSEGSDTGYDYATVKYNASGVEQWVRTYNGPGNGDDGATAIAVDGSGNVYVTGYSTGSGTGYDFATVKYNASGVEQWAIRYGGNGDDRAQDLAVDASGNVYVTGYRNFGMPRLDDYVTIKYNASGVEQWNTPYNATVADRASSLALDQSGNVYVTGLSYKAGQGYDYATVKYNSGGTQQWAARYNGPGNGHDQAQEVAVDGSGNVYVTGYSTGSDTGYDYATVKYNSGGTQQWVATYNGPGNGADEAYDLAVGASGNVYVTGYSTGSGGNYDYATIKYSESGSPAVGGVAELPVLPGDSAGEAGARRDGSSWSAGDYAALAGGLAAVALFIAAGGRYARRRGRAG